MSPLRQFDFDHVPRCTRPSLRFSLVGQKSYMNLLRGRREGLGPRLTQQAIKEALTSATLLVHPKPNALTCVMTDASDTAIGAALQQYIIPQLRLFPGATFHVPIWVYVPGNRRLLNR